MQLNKQTSIVVNGKIKKIEQGYSLAKDAKNVVLYIPGKGYQTYHEVK
jgi:hypothetical protein